MTKSKIFKACKMCNLFIFFINNLVLSNLPQPIQPTKNAMEHGGF